MKFLPNPAGQVALSNYTSIEKPSVPNVGFANSQEATGTNASTSTDTLSGVDSVIGSKD